MGAKSKMMTKYLVGYDYGMGGTLAYVLAPSAEAISRQYPDLTVLDQPPSWWESHGMESQTPVYTIDTLAQDWVIARRLVEQGRAKLQD